MKYLNKYKVFESNSNDIIQYCKDILVCFDDDLIFNEILDRSNSKICVKISSSNNFMDYDKYHDDFEHLFNYLKSEGFIMKPNEIEGLNSILTFEYKIGYQRISLLASSVEIDNISDFFKYLKSEKIGFIRLIFERKL